MPDVLLVRADSERDAHALRAAGVEVEVDSYLEVAPLLSAELEAAALADVIATDADWLIVASQSAITALAQLVGYEQLRERIAQGVDRGLRFAAVGHSTAALLRELGAPEVVVGEPQSAAGLLVALKDESPGLAALPLGEISSPALRLGLQQASWRTATATLYSTKSVDVQPRTVDSLAAGAYRVVVLRSPSAVTAVAKWVDTWPAKTSFLCGGETTFAAAQQAGVPNLSVSAGPSAESIAQAVVGLLHPVKEEN